MKQIYEKRGSEYYYTVRARRPITPSVFIFLNKTCFNGLFRVNHKGLFNVPIGRYKDPAICDEANILNCAMALYDVSLSTIDFETWWPRINKYDFIYFDPPYAPLNESSFTKYTAGDFGKKDQERLASYYKRLTSRGAKALLSNSDTPFVRKLYRSFEIIPVRARRAINSKGSGRQAVGEVLVKNY
jgi:DNA adenine methylase